MNFKSDITIIGAGVIGLAIAAQVAGQAEAVYVLEKNERFGQEISSRHSGVIHSGIYYPYGSLKAKLCVEGNRLLYELCRKHGIGHKKLGKLIVAASDEETAQLQELQERGRRNGAEGLKIISRRELNEAGAECGRRCCPPLAIDRHYRFARFDGVLRCQGEGRRG